MKEAPKQVEAVITAKKKINHDSYIYSFKYTGQPIKFTISQHFKIIKTLPTHDHPQGQQLARKYTPINLCSQHEPIDFLVKIYRPNEDPAFPPGGKYTPFLQAQEVGDKLIIDGPYGYFDYLGKGSTVIDDEKFTAKRLFFIAGGSGITPVFQTILQIAQMKDQTIQMVLLYANKTQEDIVLRKQLQDLSDRVKIHYTLDKAPNEWQHFTGYITQEMLKTACPLDDPETLYIHCGHKLMNKFLRQLFATNYPTSKLFKY